MLSAPPPFDPLAPLPLGLTLLEASAGTGKTFCMTTIWLRLVLEYGIDPGAIAVVTYTRSATHEIKSRLRARLFAVMDALRSNDGSITIDDGHAVADLAVHLRARQPEQSVLEARVLVGLDGLDEAPISTIHGFCQKTLLQHTAETGLTATRTNLDSAVFQREISDDFWTLVSTEVPPQLFANLLKAGINAEKCFELTQLVAKHPNAVITTLDGGEEVEVIGLSHASLSPRTEDVRTCETVSDVMRLLVRFARVETRRRAAAAQILGFDDMLIRLDDALQDESAGPAMLLSLRGRYQAALIDEFQDTDALQWRIFSTIFHTEAHRLIVIGDPKQSIYGFRNADIQTYFEASRRVDQHYCLNINYRADANLVRALGGLFGSTAGQLAFLAQEIHLQSSRAARPASTTRPEVAPLRLALVLGAPPGTPLLKRGDFEVLIASSLALDVAAFLGRPGGTTIVDGDRERPATASDIAVIVRTHAQASHVRAALLQADIPCTSNDRRNVFESQEALELLRVLKSILLPRHLPWIRAALTTSFFGLSLYDVVKGEREGDRLLATTAEALRALQQLWLDRGFYAAFRRLIADSRAQILSRDGGEESLARLQILGELMHETATAKNLSPPYLVFWLEDCMREPARALAGREIAKDTQRDGVTIVTVHSAKGLEYPFVWVPFGCIPQGPGRQDATRVVRPPGGEAPRLQLAPELVGLGRGGGGGYGGPFSGQGADSPVEAARNAAEEDLRVLYVACTRARHQCTVFFSNRFAAWHDSALGGLLFGEPAPNAAWTPEHQRRALRPLLSAAPEVLVATLQDRFPRPLFELVFPDAAPATPVPTPDTPAEAPSAPAGTWTRARPVDDLWRRSSFSAIVRDFTADSHGPAPVEPLAVADGGDEGHDPAMLVDTSVDVSERDLLPLPGSALLGNAIHRVLEHLDFKRVVETDLVTTCATSLAEHGLDPKDGVLVATKLAAVIATPLTAGFALADLGPDARLNELDFVMPLVGAHGTEPDLTVAGHAIVETLASFPNPGIATWLKALATQPLKPLRGFLSGSIDLVFRDPINHKYFIADWKSNRLGPTVAHYGPAHLLDAMDHHHYHLQYHLYSVAFLRFMRSRIPDFDMEAEFGGIYYFFIRGMAPQHPRDTGVFFTRPPVEAIEALDILLGGHMKYGGTP